MWVMSCAANHGLQIQYVTKFTVNTLCHKYSKGYFYVLGDYSGICKTHCFEIFYYARGGPSEKWEVYYGIFIQLMSFSYTCV